MAVIPQDSMTGPLAPKFNLQQDTRDPNNKPESKGRENIKWAPLAVFFLFSLGIIPLTMNQLSTRQSL